MIGTGYNYLYTYLLDKEFLGDLSSADVSWHVLVEQLMTLLRREVRILTEFDTLTTCMDKKGHCVPYFMPSYIY